MRTLATRLGTSPATVGSAYRILRERGLALGEGRRGTRVAARPALRVPAAPPPAPAGRRDLAHGLPDPALLPALGPALARVDLERTLSVRESDVNDPRLLDLARAAFAADGVPGDALTVLGGALDGIQRVLGAQLAPGDRVAVEDPAYPPLRDLLRLLRLVEVPVAVDDRGLRPEALRRALQSGVRGLVIVPRAQNPLGAAVDGERAAALRAQLAGHPELLIVEDDHAGLVAGAPYVSHVDAGRRRWAVIRSASKMLHPDLRLALVAGDADTIARVEGRHALGSRWVSRLLQATAFELLSDRRFAATALRACDAYAARRAALLQALARHGVAAHGRSGMNVWVPVPEEAAVVRALADDGWRVAAGERFRVRSAPAVRITTSTLPEDEAPEVAQALADALADSGPARRRY